MIITTNAMALDTSQVAAVLKGYLPGGGDLLVIYLVGGGRFEVPYENESNRDALFDEVVKALKQERT